MVAADRAVAHGRTENGAPIIFHAEGVVVQEKGQALSSTPEACGMISHHARRRRVSLSSDLMGATGRERGVLGIRAFQQAKHVAVGTL